MSWPTFLHRVLSILSLLLVLDISPVLCGPLQDSNHGSTLLSRRRVDHNGMKVDTANNKNASDPSAPGAAGSDPGESDDVSAAGSNPSKPSTVGSGLVDPSISPGGGYFTVYNFTIEDWTQYLDQIIRANVSFTLVDSLTPDVSTPCQRTFEWTNGGSHQGGNYATANTAEDLLCSSESLHAEVIGDNFDYTHLDILVQHRVSRTDGYGDTYYWTRSGRASYVKGQQLYECSYQAPFHDIWHCSLTAPNIISLWNLDRDENVRVYNNSRGQPNYDAIPTNH